MRLKSAWLILALALCGAAVVALAVAIVFLTSSTKVDAGAEVGKWLLTVAAGLLITGALSMIVKQFDERRSEREAWHAVLQDLVAANQIIMQARFRLRARRSAKSYQEQLGDLMRARVELRRISATGIVIADQTLRPQITAMHDYLDALGLEYEREYPSVARQQRLDELWLSEQMKAANDGKGQPKLPEHLANVASPSSPRLRTAAINRNPPRVADSHLSRLVSEKFACDPGGFGPAVDAELGEQ